MPPADRAAAYRQRKSGMVLLIVLVCVGLLAILIISFMIGATSELASSKQFLASSETQNLASSTLNFAMGQVVSGASANSTSVSWASQPGMIRDYGTSGTSATALYKLYSNSQMVLTGAAAAAFTPGTDLDALWDTKPALYTDLNAPATNLSNSGGTTTSTLLFPIVDPRAIAGSHAVAGFNYSASIPSGATMDGVTVAQSATDTTARLPMPVQWLYVLKDGTFIAPDSTSVTTATFANSPTQPTAANPIIGRVAFWTDDESCKVNVNTASEGCFWDTPMANFANEGPLNNYTPAAGEYQRYMGHPATTSLSPIFPWLKGTTSGHTNDLFIDLNPRTVTLNIPPSLTANGGSLEGTVWYQGSGALPIKADRMYDSVDEYIFDQSRLLLANDSVFNAANVTVTPSDLENRRFFLTAHSRSPELTLFNTPRVAIWPLNSSVSAQQASEKLIAFAATVGNNGRQYYFTRSTPLDSMSDFNDTTRGGRNAQLLGYLQSLTGLSVPGYGSNVSLVNKWTAADRDQILVEIYDYIRSCINLRTHVSNGVVVTSGGTSYTPDSNGAAEVFPTVLPAGTALGSNGSLSVATRGFGRFPTVREVSMVFGCSQNPAPMAASGVPMVNPTNPNQLAGTTPYASIWPALMIEMFQPACGLKQYYPNVKVKVNGLAGAQAPTWTYFDSSGKSQTVNMFSSDTKVFTALNNVAYNVIGQVSNGYLGVPMLYTDTASGTADPTGTPQNNYSPYFYFNGGTVNITVDIAVPPSGNDLPTSMQQTFTIAFPAIPNPLPNPAVAVNASGNSYGTMAARVGYGPQYPVVFSYAQGPSSTLFPDIIKSMVVKNGDYRLVAAATGTVTGGVGCSATNPGGAASNTFVPHAYYFNAVPLSNNLPPTVPATGGVGLDPNYFSRTQVSHPADINYYDAYNLTNPVNLGAQIPQYLTSGGQGIGQYVLGSPSLAPYQGYAGSPESAPAISPAVPGVVGEGVAANSLGRQGDWDNGPGNAPDGPYINKVDEGTDLQEGAGTGIPFSYLNGATFDSNYPQQQRDFGPMRQIASPVTFGSLSTGVQRNLPWQTLLFCPNPAASYSGSGGSGGFTSSQHPGFATNNAPPDDLLLDLFWMPITEPYAISDSMSTAGKVNLNYQILPFTYITRNTAMQAVLANQMLAAFDESTVTGGLAYKYAQASNAVGYAGQGNLAPDQSRYPIDATQTLSQFDTKFSSGDIFHSAGDICGLFLVPQGFTLANVMDTSAAGFWSTRRLTGDNMRERPYNAIYPRVTTQSNVYTVYVKAQSLKQAPATLNTAPATFTEGKDVVQGEFQAAYTFERYLDPNAVTTASDLTPLGSQYKLRVINQRTLSR